MKVAALELPGVLLIEPQVHADDRGRFLETWNSSRYAEAGIPADFRQDNVSYSKHGVIRGLHFQHPNSQGKLISVLRGEVFDVAVDVRVGSATFGRWTSVALSAQSAKQLYLPAGFAHGFAVVSDDAIISYKCSEHYDPGSEVTIRWDDPDLRIPWPVSAPELSDKDASGKFLKDISESCLPVVAGSAPGLAVD